MHHDPPLRCGDRVEYVRLAGRPEEWGPDDYEPGVIVGDPVGAGMVTVQPDDTRLPRWTVDQYEVRRTT